jgi:hypothetical protein
VLSALNHYPQDFGLPNVQKNEEGATTC